jgi:hypothetical protein
MVIIPFTRKRDIRGLKEPTLFCKTLQLSSEVKYLGLTLDKGLTRKKELDRVTNKAYTAFWACRRTFGRTWGLRTKVVHWIYTVVVRPIVTYAATVWWPRVKFRTSRAELSNLQRMACLGITGAMRTAPPAATEVLFGLPPLHLQLEAEARAGIYRFYCSDQLKPKSEGSGHTYMTQGTKKDKIVPRHVYGKPFTDSLTEVNGEADFNPIGKGH